MKHIKLFEAYSADEYQKVLLKVKTLIQKDKSKDEILSFINKYASDDIKKLDGIRLIIDRINKNYTPKYLFYNRREVTKGKRNPKTEVEYDHKLYFMFNREQQQGMRNFLNSQYDQYNTLINSIGDIDLKLIRFYMEKIFELLVWVNDTAPIKMDINNTRGYLDNVDSEDKKFKEIEALYKDKDFENEHEELKKLSARAKMQIKKISSSL